MFQAIVTGILIGWEIWEEVDDFLDPLKEIPFFGE